MLGLSSKSNLSSGKYAWALNLSGLKKKSRYGTFFNIEE